MTRRHIKKIEISCLMVLLYLFSSNSVSHGGEDPIKELNDSHSQIGDLQKTFNQKMLPDKKYKNLSRQLSALQSRILILRNELVKDRQSACFKQTTDMNYFLELSQTLKMSNKMLKQTKNLLKDSK